MNPRLRRAESRSPRSILGGRLLLRRRRACQSRSEASAAAPAQARELVEIFSWWSAPGEADALEALIAAHQATHPRRGSSTPRWPPGRRRASHWTNGCARNEPPDIFQEYIHAAARGRDASGGHADAARRSVRPASGLRRSIFPEIIQRRHARRSHLRDAGQRPPREHALLQPAPLRRAPSGGAADGARASWPRAASSRPAGVVPLATADQGWILRIMFNALALARWAPSAYHDYFMGLRPVDVAPLRERRRSLRGGHRELRQRRRRR